jgi:hypothetical protein
VRDDIVRQYAVSPAKIRVVHAASPIGAYRLPEAAEREVIRRKVGAPEAFALYPALTYQHKNHVRLLEAVARLRDRYHVTVPVVVRGRRNSTGTIRDGATLGLQDQVIFPLRRTARTARAVCDGAVRRFPSSVRACRC